ncbi:DMT family transporter [Gudongella sp. DL1XJH-153]|uniref:DMT family transporter n=1 Tax=Gudongella sp. DL1XJH-153 TaxID=3409804 RepID=UPI003BB5E42B
MIEQNIGELAALATAFSWTLVGIFFGKASSKIGSLSVNFIKLVFGFAFLTVTAYITRGVPFPTDASIHNWTWLTVSGIIGFFLGDFFMLKAYIEVGVRISLLMMATSPPMAALFGYFLLGETLSLSGVIGMMVTIMGIVIVVMSRDRSQQKMRMKYSPRGLFWAFLGALGQAVGLIFSKMGLLDYNTFAATQIRIIAGFISFVIFVTVMGRWGELKLAIKDREAIKYTLLGSIFGPFLGVSLSLVALRYTTAGIASTITSITPITIIPFSILLFKEKVKPSEIFGAFVSVAGVAILLLL